MMIRAGFGTAVLLGMAMSAGPTLAQQPGLGQRFAAYSPGASYDQMSWQAFVSVVTPAPGGQGLTLETWATDQDTYQEKPSWPGGLSLTAAALAERPRFQASLLAQAHVPAGLRSAAITVGGCGYPVGDAAAGNFPTGNPLDCIAEEVRRNRDSFDYIVNNGLYTQTGIENAFAGPGINFPTSAIELKLDWVEDSTLVKWLNANNVQTPPGFVKQNYYTTVSGNKVYALLSMHISTKQLPNWLWATFEHQLNPGRCDTMGCYDQFGVTGSNTSIAPLQTPQPGAAQNQYPACVKSPALAAMFSAAGLADVWKNYCLKGSQIDFLSTQNATMGLPVVDGDSVIERITAAVPINQSSCVTCHAYAAVAATGCVSISDNPGLGSPGPIGLVNWAYLQKQKMYDFVWGVIKVNGEKGSVCH
jgi:hypothetical protein